MNYFRILNYAVLAVLFSISVSFAGQGLEMLPASKTPPPEVAQMEQMARQKVPPPRQEKLTRKQLEDKLMANPQERGKLQAIKAGKKLEMLPASQSAPPEVAEMEKRARQAGPPPQAKKLSKEELEKILMSNPAERQKLEQIKKQGNPGAALDDKKGFSLNWLNPFHVSEAHAATIVPRSTETNIAMPVLVSLSEANHWSNSSPWSFAKFDKTPQGFGYRRDSVPMVKYDHSTASLLWMLFTAPSAGWYVFDFYASGNDAAQLVLRDNNNPRVLATWNPPKEPSFWNHYVTLQYLDKGSHYFDWYPKYNTPYTYMNRITINPWP